MTPDEVKQYIDVIVKAVQPLGDKAVAAVKTYNVLAVRQVYIDGIEAVLFGLLFCFGIWKAWRTYRALPAIVFIKPDVSEETKGTIDRYMNTFDLKRNAEEDFKLAKTRRNNVLVLLIVATVVSSLICVISLFNGADLLANPQYWAIKRLVGK